MNESTIHQAAAPVAKALGPRLRGDERKLRRLAPEHLDPDLAVRGQPGALHALAVEGVGDIALDVYKRQEYRQTLFS